jgi:hypothetical protein
MMNFEILTLHHLIIDLKGLEDWSNSGSLNNIEDLTIFNHSIVT